MILNEKSRRLPIDRRLTILFGFASLRWYYPTGSRGHPFILFRDLSAGPAPPANLFLFYAYYRNCQGAVKTPLKLAHPQFFLGGIARRGER
jgi:hypothetical protein